MQYIDSLIEIWFLLLLARVQNEIPINFDFYTNYNSFIIIQKIELYPEQIEEVWLDQIKWVSLTDSNKLRTQLIKNNSNILICYGGKSLLI